MSHVPGQPFVLTGRPRLPAFQYVLETMVFRWLCSFPSPQPTGFEPDALNGTGKDTKWFLGRRVLSARHRREAVEPR